MFKLKSKTTFDLALGAIDLMDMDLDDLVTAKESAISIFHATSDKLGKINEEIEDKIVQCTSLIATLSRIREELESQRDDNAAVRGKILDLLGKPETADIVLDDKSTFMGGSDDFDTGVEE